MICTLTGAKAALEFLYVRLSSKRLNFLACDRILWTVNITMNSLLNHRFLTLSSLSHSFTRASMIASPELPWKIWVSILSDLSMSRNQRKI